MVSQEKEFEDLLSEMAARRQRAYRKATIYTIIPVVVGALWLSFSVYQVYRLNKQINTLNQQKSQIQEEIQRESADREQVRQNLADAADELNKMTQKLQDLKATIKQIEDSANPKQEAKEVLQAINRSTPIEVITTRPTPAPTPDRNSNKNPTPEVTKTGFKGTVYIGRDKTVINIEVTAENTRLSVTYNLDGKPGTMKGNSFAFTLDKSQHDPTRLIMFFDFFSEKKDGVYKVKITASDGSTLSFVVKEPNTQTITRAFIFDII